MTNSFGTRPGLTKCATALMRSRGMGGGDNKADIQQELQISKLDVMYL